MSLITPAGVLIDNDLVLQEEGQRIWRWQITRIPAARCQVAIKVVSSLICLEYPGRMRLRQIYG
jgi:invasion protein IalB